MGENRCTLLVHFDKGSPSVAEKVTVDLRCGDVPAKIGAMKLALMLLLNGNTLPDFLSTFARYVFPIKDRIIEKLFYLCLEIVDTREIMLHFSEYFLYNLVAEPNGYICAVTLRFLCRLRDPEVLHPLVPSITANLDHKHDLVRHDALSVILAINHLPGGQTLLPNTDVCKLVLRAVAFDQDEAVRRNAFVLLCDCAQDLAVSTIKQSLGNMPFYTVSEERESTDSSKPAHPVMNCCTACSKRPVVLAEDAYATHIFSTNAAISAPVAHGSLATKQYLRSLVVSGDFHLAAVVACTLTKLVLRLEEVHPSKVEVNKASTESLLIMVSFLQLDQSFCARHPIDRDWYNRIVLCVKLLCNSSVDVKKVWLLSFRKSFAKMLAEKMKIKALISYPQPDDLIDFYHLKRRGLNQHELDDDYRDNLKAATAEVPKGADDANSLNRVVQLTGFSDPVYAEAYVTVNQYYDAVVDVTVINRTKEALQNLCLEFETAGKDLIVTDRSENYTLGPQEIKQIQVNIKMSSANSPVIVGRIVYETSNGKEHSEVLNIIFINILDYISPATCTDIAFRNMWAERQWQDELKVNTVLQDEMEFLNFIIKSTNMTCLTPPSALDGDSGFIAANLYAKSVFGDDVLMNICVEKQANGKLGGCIRIKGKIQGLVLSLGHIISGIQRASVNAAMRP